MNTILIGNAISFVGACMMVLVGLIKKKEHALIAQCGQFGVMGLGYFVLDAKSGLITNAVSILRNIVCLKKEFTVPLKIIFILIQIGAILAFNTDGFFGWLPAIAAIVFTWFMDVKSDTQFKLVIIFTELFWIAFDIHCMNYTSLTFDILTLISNGVGILRIKRSTVTEA